MTRRDYEMYQVGTYADGAPRMMYMSANARARCDLMKAQWAENDHQDEIAAAKARNAARKAKASV